MPPFVLPFSFFHSCLFFSPFFVFSLQYFIPFSITLSALFFDSLVFTSFPQSLLFFSCLTFLCLSYFFVSSLYLFFLLFVLFSFALPIFLHFPKLLPPYPSIFTFIFLVTSYHPFSFFLSLLYILPSPFLSLSLFLITVVYFVLFFFL